MRFLPVETICFAGLEEIKKAAAELEPPISRKTQPCRTFAVQYEHRASVNLNRMEVINAVVDQIAAVRLHHLACCDPGNLQYIASVLPLDHA